MGDPERVVLADGKGNAPGQTIVKNADILWFRACGNFAPLHNGHIPIGVKDLRAGAKRTPGAIATTERKKGLRSGVIAMLSGDDRSSDLTPRDG